MIHPTAVIGEQVRLGEEVSVGAYTVIEGEVTIGDGCRVGPHCHISGYTTIGARTTIHNGAVVGDLPQDYDFQERETYCRIGEDCIIREYVTIHRGTTEGSATTIGNNCMLMAFVHVAHNCQLADRVIIANNTLLAGHVHIGERAFLSARVSVHQFVHIGTIAMVSGAVQLNQDAAPYVIVGRDMVREHGVYGPNVVGLRRAGYSLAQRTAIKDAVKIYFFSDLNQSAALDRLTAKYPEEPAITAFIDFVRGSKRGITPGVPRTDRDGDEG